MTLHPFDEYPIHQAPMPLMQPVTGDPNAYDRYFFHGYDATGMIFVAALGVYPNRSIIDAAFCVSREGRQRSVFASGRLPRDRATTVGPITVEVVDPMRTLRVTVDAPEQGLTADLGFRARTAAIEEPRQTMMERNRVILDSHRYTQFGRWSGTVTTGDVTLDVDAARTAGTRDRSWGIRPLAGATPASPGEVGGIWWNWAPLQLEDRCLFAALQEDADGYRKLSSGALVADVGDGDPWNAGDTITHARDIEFDIDWEPGWRRARTATVRLRHVGDREDTTATLEPIGRIFLRGVGYLNFDRPHGGWHDELSVVGEEVDHSQVTAADFTALHVQQVVRVTSNLGDGLGVLEQLAMGPHTPSGLTGFMDPPD